MNRYQLSLMASMLFAGCCIVPADLGHRHDQDVSADACSCHECTGILFSRKQHPYTGQEKKLVEAFYPFAISQPLPIVQYVLEYYLEKPESVLIGLIKDPIEMPDYSTEGDQEPIVPQIYHQIDMVGVLATCSAPLVNNTTKFNMRDVKAFARFCKDAQEHKDLLEEKKRTIESVCKRYAVTAIRDKKGMHIEVHQSLATAKRVAELLKKKLNKKPCSCMVL